MKKAVFFPPFSTCLNFASRIGLKYENAFYNVCPLRSTSGRSVPFSTYGSGCSGYNWCRQYWLFSFLALSATFSKSAILSLKCFFFLLKIFIFFYCIDRLIYFQHEKGRRESIRYFKF